MGYGSQHWEGSRLSPVAPSTARNGDRGGHTLSTLPGMTARLRNPAADGKNHTFFSTLFNVMFHSHLRVTTVQDLILFDLQYQYHAGFVPSTVLAISIELLCTRPFIESIYLAPKPIDFQGNLHPHPDFLF